MRSIAVASQSGSSHQHVAAQVETATQTEEAGPESSFSFVEALLKGARAHKTASAALTVSPLAEEEDTPPNEKVSL